MRLWAEKFRLTVKEIVEVVEQSAVTDRRKGNPFAPRTIGRWG
jgi:hypothetical protein